MLLTFYTAAWSIASVYERVFEAQETCIAMHAIGYGTETWRRHTEGCRLHGDKKETSGVNRCTLDTYVMSEIGAYRY